MEYLTALSGGPAETGDRLRWGNSGDWRGKCTHYSAVTADTVAQYDYELKNVGAFFDAVDEDLMRVTGTIVVHGEARRFTLRYKMLDFHVFGDGSYTSEHYLLELFPDAPVISMAIEHSIFVSNEQRIRVFCLYGIDKVLERIISCNETRVLDQDTVPASLQSYSKTPSKLSEDPLSVTALVGCWVGEARCKRTNASGSGFLSFRTNNQFGWDYETSVRRSILLTPTSTILTASNESAETNGQKNGNGAASPEPIRTTTYGEYDGNRRIAYGQAPWMQTQVLLDNGCYVLSQATLQLRMPWITEMGVLVSSKTKKRVTRLYSEDDIALSDTMSIESLIA